MIKVNGKILTLKQPARISFNFGWNNSMASYYPTITAYYFINNKVESETFQLGEHHNPEELRSQIETSINNSMLYDLELYEKNIRDGIEQLTVRKGKLIEVVKGRKIPIGTTGQCFWIGLTRFGTSVGIETKNGRLFTSLNNVKVIS